MSEGEVTLSQFVESKWFKLISRGCMIMLLPAFISLSSFILGLQRDVGEVRDSQTERAAANDSFQAAITGDVQAVKGAVSGVNSEVAKLGLDMQFVRGVLEEMRRRDVAAFRTPSQ